ncbi:MAG TPA: helix-turn-helix domain-containing protein [Devosia sp.]|nr:helix-turn-helix domain-containing protein [Devosia sp.]
MANAGLPKVIAEIADAAGADAAWAMAQAHGGQRVFIPADASAGAWLVQLVGLEAAQKICALYRVNGYGATILIPMGRWTDSRGRLARALDAGATAKEAAGQSGLHERTVYRERARRKSGQPKNPNQSDLF